MLYVHKEGALISSLLQRFCRAMHTAGPVQVTPEWSKCS